MTPLPSLEIPIEVREHYMDEFVPSWTIGAKGPIPFGQTDPVYVVVKSILVDTREDAEVEFRDSVRMMCEQHWNREYEEDEWVIDLARIRHGN